MTEAWTLFGVEPEGDMLRSADISPDGLYRYLLHRTWAGADRLPFIMLNPSTADHAVDDPTIRRCIGFARDLGYGGITVANLYAFRATKPADLWRAEDPVGPRNDQVLRNLFALSSWRGVPVVAAWGANAKPDRVAKAIRLSERYGDGLTALGVTKDGAPRHPLYLPAAARPEPWSPS